MVKKLANIFGVVLLALGVLGFVPGITTADGMLLGIFHVNPLHNIVHIVSGALALWAAMTSLKATKMYFQVFGVLYALITVLGFVQGDLILGLLANNMADNMLHIVIAAIALYAGFGMKEVAQPAPVTPTM
jgi:hypothetical protein